MKTRRIALLLCAVVCSGGPVTAQTEWVNHPDNPVLENGEPGEWDAAERIVGGIAWDGSMYHMVFAGDGEDPDDRFAVGHATSTDGVTWEMDPNNPVLTKGADGEWDDFFVLAGPLVYDGNGFQMWYDGHDGDIDRTGYATSPDGSVWTKHPSNPVLAEGAPGSFDENGGWPMSVIVSNGTLRMWYSGIDSPNRYWRIGYAESADGISWTKHPTPVLGPGRGWDSWDVWDPSVVYDGTTFHMWYSGSEDGIPTGIGYAVSSDGVEWTKHRYNPVIPSADRWASAAPVVFDGSAFHMWYHQWDEDSASDINYATSNCCPVVAAMDHWQYIPAAAVAAGAEGAFYQTDVDVSNADDQSVDYEFSWLPRAEDNSEPTASETFTLGAGASVRYTKVLTEVFDLEPDSFGALLIRSSSPDLLAMSRTYNLQVEETGGTFGQAMPAFSLNDFISYGETRRILFGSENADMRTNIGCQNGTDRSTVVYLDCYDAQGASLGREMLILKPLGNEQVNRIFDGHNPVNGYVDVSLPQPDRFVYCYGSVLDNVTSDPTTIPPQ